MKTLIYQCKLYGCHDNIWLHNIGLFRTLPTEKEFTGAMKDRGFIVISMQYVSIGFTKVKFTIQCNNTNTIYDGDIEYISLHEWKMF